MLIASLALAGVFAMAATGQARADAVLMEFSSEHCPPCRAMQPVVSELIARGVPVRQVDVATEPQLTRRFQIRSTPTYVIVRNGQEVTRLLGTQSMQQLRDALQQNNAGPIIPTGSQFSSANRRRPGAMPEPQTRLAPLAGGAQSLASAPTRSVRREYDDVRGNQFANEPFSNRNRDFNSASVSAGNRQWQATEMPKAVESLPNVALADAIERAQAATVRLRVYDGRGYGAGTGTIIDVHGEEALVLTCGHLFRDGDGNDKIEVDIFVGGQPKTVQGTLVDFDAGDRDIGLVAIRPGTPVQAVDIIRDDETVRVGQTAFSFGCDRGDDPSRRDTRITGVDKYNQNINASNLEIAGAPIDGRSGGGLFDERGCLIGVCNAADYKSDIGIYTGPGSIAWQLGRVKLSHLHEPTQFGSDAALARQTNDVRKDFDAASVNASLNPATLTQNEYSSMEMTVILRDRNGNAREQVLTLDGPDAFLVQQIRQAASRR